MIRTERGWESPRAPRPTRRDMAQRAIKVLEDTFEAAEAAPIEPSQAALLAIDWLMLDGIALDFQAGRFLHSVANERHAEGTVSGYMRHTEMYQMLEAWRREFRERDRKANRPAD